jgi:hypothetical protein
VLLVLPLAFAGLLLGRRGGARQRRAGSGDAPAQDRRAGPPVPGLSVAVIEGGARLRIDNGTGETVDVRPAVVGARAAEPVIAPGATWIG